MSYNIIAAIRKDKKDSKGLVPVYVFVYQGANVVSKISLNTKIDPTEWNAEKRRVDKKAKNATLINSLIDKTISDTNARILTAKVTEAADDIVSVLKKEKAKEIDFYEFAEKQIKEKDYSEETRRTYRHMIAKFKQYRKNLRLSDITFSWLQSFEAYLRDDLKNANNTIWSNFKFINTIVNDAIKAGYLKETPFKNFKRQSYRQTGRTFLNAAERALIEDFAANAPTVEQYDRQLKTAANYFLFMCYTGLRISDAFQFDPALHIFENERIIMTSQKTNQPINLYLTDKIRHYVEYIKGNKITGKHATFNYSLQHIIGKLGIEKNITAHVARHTFGSTLVDLGVDMKVAQGLLAHGSIESTKVYYHVKSTNLDDAMKRFNKAV